MLSQHYVRYSLLDHLEIPLHGMGPIVSHLHSDIVHVFQPVVSLTRIQGSSF